VNHSAEFRRCLEECDVAAVRKLWRHVAPQLHQPADDHETLATIHRARTEAAWMHLRARAYSHRWLLDNGYPSALPDELRPKAERIYPRIVEAVGISVNGTALLRPVTTAVHRAMSDAVMDAYADGRTDPAFIRGRMAEARIRTLEKMLGKAWPGL
jgi:hypothetical protein